MIKTTITVNIDDDNSHAGMLKDILKELEYAGWASFKETKEEWCTLLMCDREDPDFLNNLK